MQGMFGRTNVAGGRDLLFLKSHRRTMMVAIMMRRQRQTDGWKKLIGRHQLIRFFSSPEDDVYNNGFRNYHRPNWPGRASARAIACFRS
jgi:hypothetical protein